MNVRMDRKDSTIEIKRLSHDIEFYNNVFKKIEKISSVVFYILSYKKDNSEKSLIETSLEKKSFNLHELSLAALDSTQGQTQALIAVQSALLSLLSSLQVAVAARVLPESMHAVIVEQIDSVQRYIANHYLPSTAITFEHEQTIAVEQKGTSHGGAPTTVKKPTTPRARRVAVPSGDISSDAYLVYSQLNDRTERIKTVLEAKPQATVKDIAEIITDVSEKTIQRDLNSLIEKGQVIREGERRWSKYSVIKD